MQQSDVSKFRLTEGNSYFLFLGIRTSPAYGEDF